VDPQVSKKLSNITRVQPRNQTLIHCSPAEHDASTPICTQDNWKLSTQRINTVLTINHM
jgi:hypothetical protein